MCIFLDDIDYRYFIHLFGDVVEEFAIDCWNHCVMPNHYHATLQPARTNLSRAMQRLNGDYARWWNTRHGHVGHVFQGRFKDQIVQRETYLLELSRYVVMNPVRAKLVERPEEWRWSSYRATVGLAAPPAFLATASTLGLFGSGETALLQERFAQFVMQRSEDEDTADRIRSKEAILGDRAFKAFVNASMERGREPSELAPAVSNEIASAIG